MLDKRQDNIRGIEPPSEDRQKHSFVPEFIPSPPPPKAPVESRPPVDPPDREPADD